MAGATDYFENIVLDSILGDNAGASVASTVYIALFTADPGETGSFVNEVNTGTYARVAVTNNSTNWPNASGGQKSNGTQITFPAADATSWGTITYVGITDNASIGFGNLLLYGQLTSGVSPDDGNTPFFDAGGITLTCD